MKSSLSSLVYGMHVLAGYNYWLPCKISGNYSSLAFILYCISTVTLYLTDSYTINYKFNPAVQDQVHNTKGISWFV